LRNLDFLVKKHYPKALIESGIRKATAIPQSELRKCKNKNHENNYSKIPLVTTHNPCNINIFPVIRSNLPILRQSDKLKDLITTDDL